MPWKLLNKKLLDRIELVSARDRLPLPRVFFHFYLRDDVEAPAFEGSMLGGVRPAALAEESVLSWSLHRTVDWPGSSAEGPDYVSVVDVTDLDVWSDGAAESIESTHDALAPFVRRIAMTVTDGAID
jgi:hypothetical protein